MEVADENHKNLYLFCENNGLNGSNGRHIGIVVLENRLEIITSANEFLRFYFCPFTICYKLKMI